MELDLCFDVGKSSCEAGRDLRVAPPAHDLEAFRTAREGVGDHEPLLVGEAEVAVARAAVTGITTEADNIRRCSAAIEADLRTAIAELTSLAAAA